MGMKCAFQAIEEEPERASVKVAEKCPKNWWLLTPAPDADVVRKWAGKFPASSLAYLLTFLCSLFQKKIFKPTPSSVLALMRNMEKSR